MNNNKFEDYIGKHTGEKMIVVGLSPESLHNFVGTGCRTIGVNDIGRHYPTDYTVCVDHKELFTDERWGYVENSKSRAVFSQLDIRHPRLCKINLRPQSERGSFLESSDPVDISYTSTFVACNIAYWMGAKKIGICGQDHNDPKHQLEVYMPEILQHLKQLKENLTRVGVELVSLSEHSRINEVLPYEEASVF